MPSKLMYFLGLFLCLFCVGSSVFAEETAPQEKKPILEIRMGQGSEGEESEELRWAPIFSNDMANYILDFQSLQLDETDPDILSMTVRAVYRDKTVIDRMKTTYADKLAPEQVPIVSEMELHFHMRSETYAITRAAVYDMESNLISEATREAEYKKIPYNSFAKAAYDMGKNYIRFLKAYGREPEMKS